MESVVKERTVFKLVQRFREGREDPKDDARSGRPSTSSGNENDRAEVATERVLCWLENLRGKQWILGKGHHRRRIVDLRVRHRAEVAEWRVETERFAETEKITGKQIKNQSHVDGFFWLPWNCAPRIRTWGSNCQRSFLSGGFEASERSCASRVTGIVGGEEMDSPPRQCPCTLRINRAWVFGAQFHRARTSPLLAGFSPLRFFSCSPNANWCSGGGIWGMWRRLKVKQHRCWRT